jgi:hypothetical protein
MRNFTQNPREQNPYATVADPARNSTFVRFTVATSRTYNPYLRRSQTQQPVLQKEVAVNERQWELYRLSVVETWSESPYKRAVSAAIEHKLMVLGQYTAGREEAARDANAVSSRPRHAVA